MDYTVLNRYRCEHGLTWKSLASIIGIKAPTLRLIAKGHITQPYETTAFKLDEFIKNNVEHK